MAEILTFEEIKAGHDGEWVLVNNPETDKSLSVVRGQVLFHSPNRDEVYRKARELKPRRFSILCFGHLPKDAAIIL
ncbi:MAG: hypothetical protein HY747_00325 [Elusimicrobia bacterium]|nr:hypothetical protein [Elusimicrobiota bacterium]